MSSCTGFSLSKTIAGAVSEIQKSVPKAQAKLLVYFASTSFPAEELAAAFQTAYAPTPVIGCTTAGELASGFMLKNSVVAMALGEDVVTKAETVFVDLKQLDTNLPTALNTLEKAFNSSLRTLSPEKHVGLVFSDGLSGAEELLLESLGNKTNVPFIGGSAGDDLKFKTTWVSSKGKIRQGAAVLTLLETVKPYEIIKTQSFKILNKTLKVTKADHTKRTVYEFNGRPAATEYASALGVTQSKLADEFMRHPLGLMVSINEPYVRSPQRIDGQAVVFYCAIEEGMELKLLEGTDIVTDTQKAVENCQAIGKISGLLNFHCILRTLQLESENKTQAYGNIFKNIPTIGFSTYGEAYVGHINQTSTMLAFRA